MWSTILFGQDSIPIPLGVVQPAHIEKFDVQWEKIEDLPIQSKVKLVDLEIPVSKLFGIQQEVVSDFTRTEFKPIKEKRIRINANTVRDNASYLVSYLAQKDGFTRNELHSIDIDEHDKLYFGGQKYFNTFNGRVQQSFILPDSIGNITDITCNHGAVWISTFNGLFQYDDGKFYEIDHFKDISIAVTSESRNGDLWISTDKHHVHIISKGKIKKLHHDRLKLWNKRMFEDQQGNKWLGTKAGIIKLGLQDTLIYDFEKKEMSIPICFSEFNGYIVAGIFQGGIVRIDGERIQQMQCQIKGISVHDLEVFNNHLWVAAYGKGLYCIQNDGTYMKFSKKSGFTNVYSIKMCHDSYGNLWVSDVTSGPVKFSEQHFKPNNELSHLRHVSRTYNFKDTSWYLMSYGFPIRRIKDSYFRMRVPDEFSDEHYYSKADFQTADHAWIDSYAQGMVQYDNNQLIAYKHSNNDMEFQTHAPIIDKWGRVWATSFLGSLKFLEGDTVYNIGKKEPALYKTSSLIKEPKGDCFFFQNNQVFRISKDHLIKTELPSAKITLIFKHKTSGIWIMIDGALYHQIGDDIVKKRDISELKDQIIYSGLHFSEDNMYFSTSGGIYKFSLSQPDSNRYFDMSYLLKEGRLVVDKNRVNLLSELQTITLEENWNFKEPESPYLEIYKTSINGQEMSLTNQLDCKPGDQLEFILDFALHGQTSELQYAFHKQNEEIEWHDISFDEIRLLNLTPGDYNLVIRGRNDDSKWQVIKLTIHVDGYWYQSIWFYLGCILFIVIIIYLIFRARLKRAEKRRIKLEAIIEDKTAEIAKEKKHVEKELKDKEILLKEVNHRVKNNMQMVSSLLELQKSKTLDEKGKENLNTAIKRIKALSIAHQHLYQGDEYESIDISSYLSVIISSLKVEESIQIDHNIMTYQLFIETAQAIGLVLNEFIQNSLKHAWEAGTTDRKIEIVFKENNGLLNFTYRDNGNKTQTIIKNDGLGKKIINAIVKRQLKGDLQESFENGFIAIINFKLD